MNPAPPKNQITGFVTQRKVISERDKAEVRSAMSYYCSADLRPFSAIEGKGFEKIAQVFIQLGAKYGNIHAEEVIPSRTTVSEFCQAEATADREVFVNDLNVFIVRYGMLGVTTDMWQDSFKKKSYVAMTVHMIQYGRLISRLLQVSKWQDQLYSTVIFTVRTSKFKSLPFYFTDYLRQCHLISSHLSCSVFGGTVNHPRSLYYSLHLVSYHFISFGRA